MYVCMCVCTDVWREDGLAVSSTVVSPGVVPDGEGSPVSGMRAGYNPALISSCSS